MLLTSALSARGLVDVERQALDRLCNIMTYAVCAVLLFTGLEAFTAMYSGIPTQQEHVLHLLAPQSHGFSALMQTSLVMAVAALAILLTPKARRHTPAVRVAAALVVSSVLIEKGIVFIPSGFMPSVLGDMVGYHPTVPEILIVLGVYAAAMLTFVSFLGPVARRLKTSSPTPAELTRSMRDRALVTSEDPCQVT